MSGLFDNLVFWHWWILAIILLILEMFSPGAFLMWIGAAAGATGLILLAVPELGWELQFLLFAINSIIAITVGRIWFKRNPISTEQPSLNEPGKDLIGNVYVVEKAIKNGKGRIKVGESTWKAIGPDLEAGSKVKVTSTNGSILIVEEYT